MCGKSSCSSVAPMAANRSKASFSTRSGSACGRSTLFSTTIGLQAHLQRLAEHELGLRHDAFLGVDQQHAAVDHAQDPLHLAAEVGVAGGVDDVDPGLAGLAVPQHRGALGQDGDAALALLVVGVHGALGVRLVGAEDAGLGEQLVDQRGLAVVDVGDDGDVAQRHGILKGGLGASEEGALVGESGRNRQLELALCDAANRRAKAKLLCDAT